MVSNRLFDLYEHQDLRAKALEAVAYPEAGTDNQPNNIQALYTMLVDIKARYFDQQAISAHHALAAPLRMNAANGLTNTWKRRKCMKQPPPMQPASLPDHPHDGFWIGQQFAQLPEGYHPHIRREYSHRYDTAGSHDGEKRRNANLFLLNLTGQSGQRVFTLSGAWN